MTTDLATSLEKRKEPEMGWGVARHSSTVQGPWVFPSMKEKEEGREKRRKEEGQGGLKQEESTAVKDGRNRFKYTRELSLTKFGPRSALEATQSQ